jgi:hypothetical protein
MEGPAKLGALDEPGPLQEAAERADGGIEQMLYPVGVTGRSRLGEVRLQAMEPFQVT